MTYFDIFSTIPPLECSKTETDKNDIVVVGRFNACALILVNKKFAKYLLPFAQPRELLNHIAAQRISLRWQVLICLRNNNVTRIGTVNFNNKIIKEPSITNTSLGTVLPFSSTILWNLLIFTGIFRRAGVYSVGYLTQFCMLEFTK